MLHIESERFYLVRRPRALDGIVTQRISEKDKNTCQQQYSSKFGFHNCQFNFNKY